MHRRYMQSSGSVIKAILLHIIYSVWYSEKAGCNFIRSCLHCFAKDYLNSKKKLCCKRVSLRNRFPSSFRVKFPEEPLLEFSWFRVERDHPFSTYAKLSEKLTFLTPWHERIKWKEMLAFRKLCMIPFLLVFL